MWRQLTERTCVRESMTVREYDTGEWPEDFLESVVVQMEKKPNATDCGDFRTISLLGHAAKVENTD